MSEPDQPIQRPGFTQTQLLQAEFIGGITEQQRAQRLQIPSYPIDNVSRDVVADRDDGVYVEAEHRNGGYRVHITIADVAAHIRPGSPLAQAAWQRAVTLYWSDGPDSLFPNDPKRRLEEKMSLEHGRERLGLTVSITLDPQFRPVHTSFMPVITHPDNSSYQEAHERMLNDPQFQLMADIATGVKKHYFGGQSVPLEEIFSRRTLRRVHSAEQMQAMEMVATYMLLANNCTAEFARKSALPFMYRNFDEQADDTRASYSTKPGRHTALARMGLKGSYCHFTSPIRRAPDYFNGVMVHYAIDVVALLEHRLRTQFPMCDAKILHQQLWSHAPELLTMVQGAKTNYSRYRVALQRVLTAALQPAMPDGEDPIDATDMRKLVGMLEFKPPPLTREELDHYADHINQLTRSPEIRAVERLNEKHEQNVDRMEAVAVADKDALARLTPEKFTSVLQAAADTGDMPRVLFDETMQRLKTGNFDKSVDGYTIFMKALPDGNRWKALKRRIAQTLKDDPSAVNSIFARFENEISPATIELLKDTLHSKSAHDRSGPPQIQARLYVMRREGQPVAAPFYSVGHDDRASTSHAKYSFLEHHAFAQLQPIEQRVMPHSLYAELDMEGTQKRELLAQIAESVGAQVNIEEERAENGRYLMRIIVHGGDFSEPIYADADEVTADEAAHVAIRRMLRNDRFKAVVGTQEFGQEMLNPQTVLEKMIRQRGGDIRVDLDPQRNGPHRARVHISLNGQEMNFTSAAPNLDRAKRAAAAKALDYFGWTLDAPQQVGSWVTDLSRQTPPRELFAGK